MGIMLRMRTSRPGSSRRAYRQRPRNFPCSDQWLHDLCGLTRCKPTLAAQPCWLTRALHRGTALPVSARRVNAGLARARVIEDSGRLRVVSVTELEDKLKDRERRTAVLKHELVARSVVRSLERAGTRAAMEAA